MSIPTNDKDNVATARDSSHAAVSMVASALILSACDKAGMEGIDRSRIDSIIMRESGNSVYMQQQRKRDEQVNERIEIMLNDLKKKKDTYDGDSWKRRVEREVDDEIHASIRSRPTRSACCVIDMDMFFMACELLTRPELKDKPCCVGGGLISTSNYVARKYGVRSAMAGFIADKLVEEISESKEQLIHLPSNFALYNEKAQQVRKVLIEYDPNMKSYSLDEAYLDLGAYVCLRLEGKIHVDIVNQWSQKGATKIEAQSGSALTYEPLAQYPTHVAMNAAADVLQEMRARVFEATGGLTCSAGLASNFMLAKIASDANKPNGQLLIGPSHDEILTFLHPLPTRKVGGIGRVKEKMLRALGVSTVGNLYEQRATVRLCFKPATTDFLLRAAVGCSSLESKEDTVDENVGRKGISRERTFEDGRPWGEVLEKLAAIACKLSEDMIVKELWARTITLKIKLHTFDVLSRSRTLPRGKHAQCSDELIQIATELLHDVRGQFQGRVFSVRLLGIRCSNFQAEQERISSLQMNIKQYLFEGAKETRKTTTKPSFRVRSERRIDHLFRPHIQANDNVTLTREIVIESQWNGEEMSVGEKVRCPICGKSYDVVDNVGLNTHVDTCLNVATVQSAARHETVLFEPRKKSRLTNFFTVSRDTAKESRPDFIIK